MIYYLQIITDQIAINKLIESNIFIFITLILINALSVSLSSLFNDYYIETINQKIKNTIMDKIISSKPNKMNQYSPGDIISRLNNDIKKVTNLLYQIASIITKPIIFICAFTYMCFISPKLSIISIVLIPITFLIVTVLKKPLQKYSKEEMEIKSEINFSYKELTDGFFIMKTFNIMDNLLHNFNQLLDTLYLRQQKILKRKVIINPFFYIARVIPVILIPIYGGILVINKEISLGQLLAFTSLISYVTLPIEAIFNFIIEVDEVKPAINRLDELYLLESEIYDTTINKNKENQIQTTNQPIITITHLSYSYDHQNTILENINLSLRQNELLAIVGESGCGKSTLINILCGFLPYDQGSVEIAGNILKETSTINIRKLISYIPQNSKLYPTTIYENIHYGNMNATKEDIIKASKKAGAHDFIMSLENKYETEIVEGGRNLSGGQLQRIAIARALLKPAPILILDEPTASLDLESEQIIYDTINEIAQDKTIILITHKLKSIINFDCIAFMKDKKIKEYGTHLELMKQKKEYYQLFEKGGVTHD